ncbi:hypothetical protein EDC01DRAFT_632543 [Geopyxis carbonaria]|nr:hypothetical protein EDC01DRAFT_632543 [Geopyxis carbonaria]
MSQPSYPFAEPALNQRINEIYNLVLDPWFKHFDEISQKYRAQGTNTYESLLWLTLVDVQRKKWFAAIHRLLIQREIHRVRNRIREDQIAYIVHDVGGNSHWIYYAAWVLFALALAMAPWFLSKL